MVRRAVPADATDLADVHVSSWQAAYAGIVPADFLAGLDRDRRAAWWRGVLEQGALVHVVGDPAVGFCHPTPSNDEGWGEIRSIYVHPGHWGEGLGARLLDAGESTLVDSGFEAGLLWVLEENSRARRFYESQGWRLGKSIQLLDLGGRQVTEVKYEKDLTVRQRSSPDPKGG
jgi:GNAT superfamily N-acetyltransferase